ncbi:MAG: hypothetical protein ACE5EX_02760 [Phycisphaerae bacterium]
MPLAPARAQVNLEWRLANERLRQGDIVDVGLVAVSNDAMDKSLVSINANVGWDPLVLRLDGLVNNGPFQWPLSAFPFDAGLDGLNADCSPTRFCAAYGGLPFNDGTARYAASAFSPNASPPATPKGLLITTLQFTATAATPAARVFFLDDVSLMSPTVVLRTADGAVLEVTGTVEPVTFEIAACGATGDFVADCVVDLFDHRELLRCLNGPDRTSPAGCEAADFGGDTHTDLRDVAGFQLWFSGP